MDRAASRAGAVRAPELEARQRQQQQDRRIRFLRGRVSLVVVLASGCSSSSGAPLAISSSSPHCAEVYPGAHAALHQAKAALLQDRPGRALVFCAGAASTLESKCAEERDPTVVALRKEVDHVCREAAPWMAAKDAAAEVAKAKASGDAPPLTSCLRLGHALRLLREHRHETEAAALVASGDPEAVCRAREP